MKVSIECDTILNEPAVAISFASGASLLTIVEKHVAHQCIGCGEFHSAYWNFSIFEFDPEDQRSVEEKREAYPYLSFTMDEDDAARFLAVATAMFSKVDPDILAKAIDWVHENAEI